MGIFNRLKNGRLKKIDIDKFLYIFLKKNAMDGWGYENVIQPAKKQSMSANFVGPQFNNCQRIHSNVTVATPTKSKNYYYKEENHSFSSQQIKPWLFLPYSY